MRATAAALACATAAGDAPFWPQTSGGKSRSGIWPPAAYESASAEEAAAALKAPRSQRLPPKNPPVYDPAKPNPYWITNVGVRWMTRARNTRLWRSTR